jgi:hypothetical protein
MTKVFGFGRVSRHETENPYGRAFYEARPFVRL